MPLVAGSTKLTELTYDEFKSLVEEAVTNAVAVTSIAASHSEFLSSRSCANLIGVTPEHLCAMRSRGEGPPWSGEGKWVRYRRDQALRWLKDLPRRGMPPSPAHHWTEAQSHPIDSLEER
jgi:hypothetical protein